MPIRFRCMYCNQLLGIARRKAGTEVNCPTCQRPVTVPLTSQEDGPPSPPPPAAIPEPSPAPAPAPALFERSDFEDYLHDPVAAAAPAAAPPPPATPPPRPGPNPFDLGHLPQQPAPAPPPLPVPTPRAAGIVLSPTGATVLTVAAILMLAVAFGVGLLIGRFL
jgi:hypothetical protein